MAVEPRWLGIEALAEALEGPARAAREPLGLPAGAGDLRRALQGAGDLLQRLGLAEADRDAEGLRALRLPAAAGHRSDGVLVTSDLEILVAPGEISARDYGRLCRLAPYVDGDVVHRHRLSAEGLRRDLEVGCTDAAGWLAELARYGLPGGVRDSLREWGRSAARVTLWTGASIVEVDGQFSLLSGPAPEGARRLPASLSPQARFRAEGDLLKVAEGADVLPLRALLDRVGERIESPDSGLCWRLRAVRCSDPAALLSVLQACCVGPLPGAVEAAVRAAALDAPVPVRPQLQVALSDDLFAALRRDPVAGPLLGSRIEDGPGVLVSPDKLPALRARLAALGIHLE